MNRHISTASLSLIALGGITLIGSAPAWADPLSNEVLKFSQLPLGGNPNTANPVFGHDELSTAQGSSAAGVFQGTFAADDFSDNVSLPVAHVQWWGSYPNPTGVAINPIQQFLISFESDVPASSTAGPGFSTPGQVLSQQIVSAGTLFSQSGTFSETPQGGSAAEPLFRYNAELKNPFPEQANTIYWLKIVALTGPNDPTQWGWHNRDYTTQDLLAAPVSPGEVNLGTAANPIWHFQDDAVSGRITYVPSQSNIIETNFAPLHYNNTTDGFPAGAVTPSEDLAFNLYYANNVPEPVGLPLLAAGMFFLRRQRRQKA